jgi:hypothetical protein
VVDGRAVVLAAGLVVALLAGARLRGRRRRRSRVPPAYRSALRLLARRGVVREPATPPRAFARQVAHALPAAGAAFTDLTEGYLQARFGRADPRSGAARAREALHRLRDSLRG